MRAHTLSERARFFCELARAESRSRKASQPAIAHDKKGAIPAAQVHGITCTLESKCVREPRILFVCAGAVRNASVELIMAESWCGL